jgi:hypothetical protein
MRLTMLLTAQVSPTLAILDLLVLKWRLYVADHSACAIEGKDEVAEKVRTLQPDILVKI